MAISVLAALATGGLGVSGPAVTGGVPRTCMPPHTLAGVGRCHETFRRCLPHVRFSVPLSSAGLCHEASSSQRMRASYGL